MGGASAEDVEGQAVEDHADHQHHAVTHLQRGGGDREFSLLPCSYRLYLAISTPTNKNDDSYVKIE